MKKQAEAFAPACALTMDEIFHGCVCTLQPAQPPHGQHRKPHRAYQKRQHKEDDAVLYGVGNQHGESQQGEQAACQLEHKTGAGQQSRAQPDEQGQNERQRCKENFQDEHWAASFSKTLSSGRSPFKIYSAFAGVKLTKILKLRLFLQNRQKWRQYENRTDQTAENDLHLF